ncbi:hypothetical protein EDC94DRAFT_645053, partial [Helicostylum pulchrum]
ALENIVTKQKLWVLRLPFLVGSKILPGSNIITAFVRVKTTFFLLVFNLF